MEFDFTKSSTLKEAAREIRVHNHIHSRSEKNAVLIPKYLDFAADLIDKLADGDIVVARHGQWLNATIDGSDFCRCSECGCYIEATFFANDYLVNFCPKCGARMDEGKGESK